MLDKVRPWVRGKNGLSISLSYRCFRHVSGLGVAHVS